MSQERLQTGRKGENLAVRFLQQKGYQIIEQNYRTRFGEIDIVASLNATIVFVEVRTRTTKYGGTGAESVGFRKQNKIRQVARYYLYRKHLYQHPVRFDVISVFIGSTIRLEHIVAAF
ncbi:MAG: YraN family protein [Bacillaceae bacterium]|nr:YraN family protein [Bacillaceae bacterium]